MRACRLNQPSCFGHDSRVAPAAQSYCKHRICTASERSLAAQVTAATPQTHTTLWAVCPPRAHTFPWLGWWGERARRISLLVEKLANGGHACSTVRDLCSTCHSQDDLSCLTAPQVHTWSAELLWWWQNSSYPGSPQTSCIPEASLTL